MDVCVLKGCLVWYEMLQLSLQAKQTLMQRMSACPEHSEL